MNPREEGSENFGIGDPEVAFLDPSFFVQVL